MPTINFQRAQAKSKFFEHNFIKARSPFLIKVVLSQQQMVNLPIFDQCQRLIIQLLIQLNCQQILYINSGMAINFDKLNFKLQKPIDCSFSDSIPGDREQTTNPFKKTEKLFRHLSKENTRQQSSNDSTLPRFNEIFSLENFDSFQNKNTKIITNRKGIIEKQQNKIEDNFMSFKAEETENAVFIKIHDNVPNIEDFSIIMDDINSTLKISDILQDSKNNFQSVSSRNFRSKTQPCFNFDEQKINHDNLGINLKLQFQQIMKEEQQKQNQQIQVLPQSQAQKVVPEIQKKEQVKKEKTQGFFLTQQSQTLSQKNSSIKEYYLDLREETKLFSSANHEKSKHTETFQLECTHCSGEKCMKKKIKKIIYSFVDELQIMDENQIDPDFIERLGQCIKKLKKKEICIPKKWDKPQKNTAFVRKQNVFPNSCRSQILIESINAIQSQKQNKREPLQSLNRSNLTNISTVTKNQSSITLTTKRWEKVAKSNSKNSSSNSTAVKHKPFK